MTAHYTDEGTLLIRNSDIKDGRFEFGEKPIFLEKSFAMANESRMHQIGDVITVHTGDVGTSAVISENEDKSIGFATIVTRPNKTIIDPSYLCTFLNTERHKKWAVAISTGDGRTNYNLGDYFELVVPVPSIKEQKQIAMFIENLNNLITLHQRKCKIRNLRCPKSTAITWEQRKLGDCFAERVESMPDGELISVTINDGIKKFSELGRHDNSNDDKSKYKKVCIGDIAYNSMRMWQGASGYSPYEGIVSPAYTVLSPNSGINSKCLAYQFKLPEMIHTFQINSQGITSDNWNLKYPALSEIEIFVSRNEKEQAKIAEYFEWLDRLITLHQRKPDCYQFKLDNERITKSTSLFSSS